MMIGIDLVSIARIETINRKFAGKFAKKFLSKKELKLVKSPATLAGFWAAKEAASKALGTGITKYFDFRSCRIYKDKYGAPKIKFKKSIKKRFKIAKAHLSISHDARLAIAVVLIKRK